MPTKVITKPTYEPLTVDDVSEYLRLDDSPTDAGLISASITAARQYLEQYLNRYIATQTIETSFDGFQNPMVLNADVQSITSVKYLDENGAEQTLASNQYLLDTYAEPAQITPAYNVTYPNTYGVPNSVKVRYVVGYTSGGSPDTNPLPDPLKFAMMLIIGDLYANREGQSDKPYNPNPTVQNMLSFYRLKMGV